VPTHASARAFLESVAKRRILITYQELANALQILPPHSIHRVTEALERLMEEDAAADRPFIAALAISKARGGLPGPGQLRPASRPVRGRSGRSGRKDVSRRRAERRLRSLGRFARQLTATTNNEDILFTETNPPPNRGQRTAQTPTNHNGKTRCPAAAIQSSGTTAVSRKSASG
jgi:hypothetical protein